MHSDEVFERKIGAIADDPLERRIGRALFVEVLDDRLDHQIALAQVVEAGGSGERRERLLAHLGGNFALRHPIVEELADAAEALLEKRVVDLPDDGLIAGGRAHLRDAGTHQSTSQHANGLYLHTPTCVDSAV